MWETLFVVFAPLKKQAQRCVVDVIIPTNLVCVLFDPAITISSFTFIQLFLYLYSILLCNFLPGKGYQSQDYE